MTREEFFKPEVISLRFDGEFSLLGCSKDPAPREVQASQIEKFGLFGDSPNFNTYYPNLDKGELTPDSEDFIYPTFRLLSEVIVTKYGVPIDFTEKGVLKNSLPKMAGITVFPDHSFDSIGNSLGVVINPHWQESYTVDGVKVPAGINGVLKLDAKANPRIARLLSMDPPAIHSSSVTVQFTRVKSHPEMSDNDFWDKVGSFDQNGELIRFVVKEVKSFMELSLVSRGADPFAQKVERGLIVNPQYAKSVYTFSADSGPVAINFREMGGELSDDTLSFSFSNLKPNNPMNFEEVMSFLGLDIQSYPNKEALITALSSANELSQSMSSMIAIVPDLTPEALQNLVDNQIPEGSQFVTTEIQQTLDQLNSLGGLEAMQRTVNSASNFVQTLRASVVSTYKLVSGENPDPVIIALIENADMDAIRALETQYSTMLEEKIPLTCQSCGSSNVTRQSHRKEVTPYEQYEATNRKLAKASRRKPSTLHLIPK